MVFAMPPLSLRPSRDAGAMAAAAVQPNSTLSAIPSYILFAVIAGAPLPFGSVDFTAISFWCIVLGCVAVTLALFPHRFAAGHLAVLGGLALLAAFYLFVLHEQLADAPWIASPHPIWAETSKALGLAVAPAVSITRDEPFFALGAPLACMLALACGLVVGIDRNRAYQILQVIAWSGAAYAIYGILSFLIEPTMILWRDKRAYLGSVTGTFINRNTAATYFGSCAVIWFAILLDRMRRHLPRGQLNWKRAPQRILTDTPRKIIIAFLMLFVCLMAMFLTGSRAGVVLSLLALIITFTIYFRRDLPPRTGVWIAMAGGGAVALILLQFMGGVVSSRFDVQGLADEGRLSGYRSTLRMIADYPWFGTGIGTFVWSFPAYRSPEISLRGVWDIAHNTPLELAADLGLPLAGTIYLAWIAILAILIRGIRTRSRSLVPLAAFSVSIIAVLHSFVDFSLQIPGFAIVLFALLGAGVAQSFDIKPANKA